ncbi:MAG: winged helix-turn-helix transcriptional regulator [Planctomycetota bacterium]|jgi:DNA-binding HxlR family transcriptional regulator
MKGYGQFCPVAKASEVLGERWTNLVVRELAAGSDSFNDLRRGLPRMSPTLLSQRLRSLESAGVVERRSESQAGSRYLLTEAGKELAPIIWQLGAWGHKWVRSRLEEDDLDPSMLMWDIRRTVNTDYFDPEGRVVVRVELSDYTSYMRFWWLVIVRGDVDLCLKDPGHEVDLYIRSDLKTLTAVWMGDSSMSREVKSGAVQLLGSWKLRRDIMKWLGSNYYAKIKPAASS